MNLEANPLSIFELQAELCRAMSHPARLEIVHLLRDGPQRAGDLAQALGLGAGTVSRHLGILRNNGILASQYKGRDILYQIVDPRVADICDLMRQILVEQASRRSQVLQAFDDGLDG